jgi:Xaa-Pro aminopeptidase
MLFQDVSSIEAIEVGDDEPLLAQLRQAGPMNLDWARQLMEARGVDALVLGDPINVFHVTGHWPFVGRTRPGAPPTMFVVIGQDPDVSPALVVSRFYYYYTMVDGNFVQQRPVYIFGDVGDRVRAGGQPDRGDAPLSALEADRAAQLAHSEARHALTEGMAKGLAAAMRDLGLAQGHLAYDYAAIPGWLEAEGVSARWEQADDILRHIRLIKSPLEIALMRRASAANLAAVHAAMPIVREGARYRDFRRRFFAEAALRGNTGVTMSVDRVSNDLSAHRMSDGQALMIDCVSQAFGYHGDYGRTLFLGEPTAPMRKAVEAMSVGWEAIREALKPGLLYSEVAAIGQAASRKAGYDFKIGFGPHSVGLMHTDEPIAWVDGLPGKADLRLRENMIISVDCPVLEVGYGGSAHLEDLTLITADGAEQIHPLTATALVI